MTSESKKRKSLFLMRSVLSFLILALLPHSISIIFAGGLSALGKARLFSGSFRDGGGAPNLAHPVWDYLPPPPHDPFPVIAKSELLGNS